MDFKKYNNFFPQKVYHCSCLDTVIISCLLDGIYSLEGICDKISQVNTVLKKIYCTKCGDKNQHVVFSCTDHMAMVIFEIKEYDCIKQLYNDVKSYCGKCIKKYLQKMYYCYEHKNFDLPMANKLNS